MKYVASSEKSTIIHFLVASAGRTVTFIGYLAPASSKLVLREDQAVAIILLKTQGHLYNFLRRDLSKPPTSKGKYTLQDRLRKYKQGIHLKLQFLLKPLLRSLDRLRNLMRIRALARSRWFLASGSATYNFRDRSRPMLRSDALGRVFLNILEKIEVKAAAQLTVPT